MLLVPETGGKTDPLAWPSAGSRHRRRATLLPESSRAVAVGIGQTGCRRLRCPMPIQQPLYPCLAGRTGSRCFCLLRNDRMNQAWAAAWKQRRNHFDSRDNLVYGHEFTPVPATGRNSEMHCSPPKTHSLSAGQQSPSIVIGLGQGCDVIVIEYACRTSKCDGSRD